MYRTCLTWKKPPLKIRKNFSNNPAWSSISILYVFYSMKIQICVFKNKMLCAIIVVTIFTLLQIHKWWRGCTQKKCFSLHEWCECFILQKSDTGIVKSNRKRNTTEEKYWANTKEMINTVMHITANTHI